MRDYSYREAVSNANWWKYGPEVAKMIDNIAARQRAEYAQKAVYPTESELKGADRLHNEITRQVRASAGSDLPPSIAQWYHEHAEKQAKQDSTFKVPSGRVGVKLNPDDSLSIVGSTTFSSDDGSMLALLLLQLDSLLDMTETPAAPSGLNTAAYNRQAELKQWQENTILQFNRVKKR